MIDPTPRSPTPASFRELSDQVAALCQARRFAKADSLCQAWLGSAPDDAEAIHLRGRIARENGQPAAALALFDAAIAHVPDNLAWRVRRAQTLFDLGETDEAIGAVDDAIARDPVLVTAYAARANFLTALDRGTEAIPNLERVIELWPDNREAVLIASSLLLADSRPDRALSLTRAALARSVDDAHLWLAHAAALRGSNRLEEALTACDRSIACQDDYADAWFTKSLILATLGRFAEGWPLYEWRWSKPDFPHRHPTLSRPLWDGSPLNGRGLLIHTEQGLGDSMQLFRFVTALSRQTRVVLYAPVPLARLFAAQQDAPEVIQSGGEVPPTDLYCMAGSLPWLLGVELTTLPAAPYLRADPALTAAWERRLPREPKRKRVGIVWAGSPANSALRYRSMPLRTMLTMLVPDVTIVSLQKDVPASDRATLAEATHVLDLDAALADFADTAAVMARLDLVISVDTATANLAGALGVPVWILLPFAADWRWMLDREDSPWYPSARLFRQDKPGDWSGLARRVREALKGFISPS